MIDLDQIHNVYARAPNKTWRLAAKYADDGDHVHVLSDYLGVFPHLSHTHPLDKELRQDLEDVRAHPAFRVVSKRSLVDGEHPDLIPMHMDADRDQGQRRPSVFSVHDGQQVHQLEFDDQGPKLNGRRVDDDAARQLLAQAANGGQIRYHQLPRPLTKAELDDAMSHMRSLVAAGHLPQEHFDRIRRELYSDEMLPEMGNKRAYNGFMSSHPGGGVHVMLDMNDMKAINDELSHAHGDDAIRGMGRAVHGALTSALGSSAEGGWKAHRFGGDEFHVHLPSHAHAEEFLNHLHHHLAATPKVGGTHNISVSAGIGHTPADADHALNHGAKGQKKAAVAALGGNPEERAGKVRAPHPLYAHSHVSGSPVSVDAPVQGPTMKSEGALGEALAKMAKIVEQPGMRPHKASEYSGRTKITTFKVPDEQLPEVYKGRSVYHHVHEEAPAGEEAGEYKGYKSVFHSLTEGRDPFGPQYASSASGVNVPGASPGAVVHGETASSSPGSGIGATLYRRMLGYHGNMESDTSVSPAAQKVWRKLLADPGVSGALGEEGTDQRNAASIAGPWNEEPVASAHLRGYSPYELNEAMRYPDKRFIVQKEPSGRTYNSLQRVYGLSTHEAPGAQEALDSWKAYSDWVRGGDLNKSEEPLAKAEMKLGSGPVKVKHYSHAPDLKALDPAHQGHPGGAGGREVSRPDRIPRVYLYHHRAEPERVVASGRHLYHGALPDASKLYDLSRDKHGFTAGGWRETEYGRVMENPDQDEIEQKVHAAGYHGYYNYGVPGAIAYFHALPVKLAPGGLNKSEDPLAKSTPSGEKVYHAHVAPLAHKTLEKLAEHEHGGTLPPPSNHPISVQIPIHVLPMLGAKNARLKNQHETSTGLGIIDKDIRGQYEAGNLGVPSETPANQRPIYGWIHAPDDGKPPVAYGAVQLVLHDHVKGRSTVTSSDSLDDFVDMVPASHYSPEVFGYKEHPPSYHEAQIHGGVQIGKDVKEIVLHQHAITPEGGGPVPADGPFRAGRAYSETNTRGPALDAASKFVPSIVPLSAHRAIQDPTATYKLPPIHKFLQKLGKKHNVAVYTQAPDGTRTALHVPEEPK